MSTTDIFIGKRDSKEWKTLDKKVFRLSSEKKGGGCYSIIGPNVIGKTYMVQKMVDEFMENPIPNSYVFWHDIKVGTPGIPPFWYFWFTIIREMEKTISLKSIASTEDNLTYVESLKNAFAFFRSAENLHIITKEIIVKDDGTKEGEVKDMEAEENLEDIFYCLSALNIRITLILDEFDRAKNIYDGRFFQYLFNLSSKQGSKKLSIILIGRRLVSTIAHGMDVGSSFASAFPAIKIRGFSDDELNEYFNLYEELSEEDKNNILYFCGRSPGMLMKVYEEYECDESVCRPYEMEFIVSHVYGQLCELMKTEFVDVQKSQACLGKFIQAFIGPVYEESIGHDISDMHGYGYISKCDEYNKYESIMKFFDPEWNSDYEPIAPYILEYVKIKEANSIVNDLSKKVALLEDLVREIIREALKKTYGDDWKNHIDDYIGEGKKDSYFKPLESLAEENGAFERGVDYSKLDVLGYTEYLKLVKGLWEYTGEYFPRYRHKEALNKDFELMKVMRNSYAHRTEKVLSRQTLINATEVCDALAISIQSVQKEKLTTPTE